MLRFIIFIYPFFYILILNIKRLNPARTKQLNDVFFFLNISVPDSNKIPNANNIFAAFLYHSGFAIPLKILGSSNLVWLSTYPKLNSKAAHRIIFVALSSQIHLQFVDSG